VVLIEADHNLITDLTIGQLLGIIATLIVVIGIVRTINPIFHRMNDLLDDWFGEKARPGVAARKGVMEHLEDTDADVKEIKAGQIEQDVAIAHLRKTVEPVVDNTQAGNHKEVLQRLDNIDKLSGGNAKHLTHLEKLINRHIRESKTWVGAVDNATKDATNFKMPPWPDMPDETDIHEE